MNFEKICWRVFANWDTSWSSKSYIYNKPQYCIRESKGDQILRWKSSMVYLISLQTQIFYGYWERTRGVLQSLIQDQFNFWYISISDIYQ